MDTVRADPILQVNGATLRLSRKRMYDLANFLDIILEDARAIKFTDEDQQLAATEVCKALNQVIKTDLKGI